MSLLLAVPVSLITGILFAILSCLHIWCIMPCVQICLINMHSIKTIWGSVLDIAISPFFKSMGKCCNAINLRLARD
ncbi:CAV2 protein, partial [Amia calva]|nr:CAV2 protein [Amia calva]